MNQRAREIAPARMTGLYGGEVLRRVRMFKPVFPMAGLFQPELIPQFEQARQTYEEMRQGNALSFNVFRQAPWHHYSNLALEQSQITMRTPFLDNEFVKAVFQAPPSLATTSEVSLRLIADGNAELSRIPTDRGLGARSKRVERLAHAIKELSFKAEYAYDYGMPQWLARVDHLFAPIHVERLFLGRHKPLHFRQWYRDQLSGYVREMLLDARSVSRPYVQRHMVERMVHEHIKGTGNYTTEIHKLLRLELLHRNFIDSSIRAVQGPDPLPAVVAAAYPY
jgi:asparagine synthase (glutamine-hydrolysing)